MEKPNYKEANPSAAAAMNAKLRAPHINWNQLFYFSVIAAHGSIKGAGEVLSLSSSTLSQHLAQLERDLDVRLFVRAVRKLTLTPEGQRLFLHIRDIFESSQRLLGVVAPLKLGSYPVAIGLVPSPSLQIAYDLIDEYQTKFGPLSMKLRHSTYAELESNLVSSDFDFGFSDRVPERKDLHWELLSASELKFYVSPKVGSKSFSTLVKELPLLVCNAEQGSVSVVERLLKEAGLSVSKTISSDFPSVLFELCDRGLGIGVFAEDPMNSLGRRELRSLKSPSDAPKVKDRIYVVWVEGNEKSEAIQTLKILLGQKKRL